MALCHSNGRMWFLFTLSSLLIFSSGNAGSLRCPSLVHIELGTNGVISCDISFEFSNLYWYSGATFSETPPVVRLENGVPEGSNGFDITTNGSLVVLNTDARREGIYTVVVFHLNNTYEHSSVSMETFAHPSPYFPVIRRCNGKQNCSVFADNKGSVHCSIYGSRPAPKIDLLGNGVTLLNFTYQNATDENTGLTNITVQADYESAECAERTNITCVAYGFAIQEVKSTLKFNDTCLPLPPTNTTPSGSVAAVAVVVVLVVIIIGVIAVVVTIYFFRKRKEDYKRVTQYDPEVIQNDNENANVTEVNKPEDTNKKEARLKENTKNTENKEKLLRALSEKYRTDYFGNSSNLKDRIISIDDVYIDLEFEVKDDRGETKTLTIHDMLTPSFTNNNKKKVFVSNKMALTFSSFFAYLWAEQEMKENILFVFNMNGVSCDNTIVSAIKQMLQNTLTLEEEDVIKIIEEFGCHIILEGVEMKEIVNGSEVDQSSKAVTKRGMDTHSKWTIGSVLRDNEKKVLPQNVFYWAVVFDRGGITAAANIPYDEIKIKDLTFAFVDGLNDYIQRIIDCYYKGSTNEQKEKFKTAVKEVILICDLKKKFEKSLPLLIQMINLIAKEYIPNTNTLNYVPLGSLLMKGLPLLKLRYRSKLSVDTSLTSLEEKLGEVAFYQMIGKQDTKPILSEDILKFSKSIGLIKQSSSAKLINFNAEEVECFVIASYLKTRETLSDFIDGTINSDDDAGSDKRFQILSFLCGLQLSYSHEICKKIIKKGRMKYFLNCFCDTANADELHGPIKKYLEKDDTVINIYDDKTHLAKVGCLLKYCKNWKITVNRVKFERISQKKSQTTVVRTEQLDMPTVKEIVFYRVHLDVEETFIYYIEWIMKLNVKIVSFDDCKLPEFSAGITFSLKTVFSNSKSKVVIKMVETDESKINKYDLNKQKIEWVYKTTIELPPKNLPDTKDGRQAFDKKETDGENSGTSPDERQQENERHDQDSNEVLSAGNTDKSTDTSQSDTKVSNLDTVDAQTKSTNKGQRSNEEQSEENGQNDVTVKKHRTEQGVKLPDQNKSSATQDFGGAKVKADSKGQNSAEEHLQEKIDPANLEGENPENILNAKQTDPKSSENTLKFDQS